MPTVCHSRHAVRFHPTPAALALAAALLSMQAHAAPTGGQVTAGTASIQQNGAVTDIHQATQKAAINWQGFGIAPNEAVNFHQPNASAITLNRVVGNEASLIQGALNANGRVFLVNANGILFTQGASVNTAGLVASTLNITDHDFLNGNFVFQGDGSGKGSILNLGTLKATDGGYVALLGDQVRNQGVIVAQLGTVALSSGQRITLNFNGDSLLKVSLDEGTLNALVENGQAIRADGGKVILTAKAANGLLDAQVNNTGIVQAQTIGDLKGDIHVYAHGGTANIDGTLDASAPNGGDGGFIETSGDTVKVADSVYITTRAANGKTGTWLIDPNDFTIGQGGDMTGATLSAQLENNDVKIESVKGATQGNGDIHVNDAVSWSADTLLTLDAVRDININAPITINGEKAGLALNYGGDYHIRTKASYAGTELNDKGIPVAKQDTSGGVYGSVTFTNAANKDGLVINGVAYTLVHSIEELKSFDKPVVIDRIDAKESTLIPTRTVTQSGNFFNPETQAYDLYAQVIRTGTCGRTTCHYNPETRQYDLTKKYSGPLTAARYYADAQGNFTILSYDPSQAHKYYNPISGAYDLDVMHPTSIERYYNPATQQYDRLGVIVDGAQLLYWQVATETYAATPGSSVPYLYLNPKTNRHDLLEAPVYQPMTGHFALARNLDAGGTTYDNALINEFDGVLAGLGHTIEQIRVDNATPIRHFGGLFNKVLGSDSMVRDLGLINTTINITGQNHDGFPNVAPLAGYLTGTVHGVYTEGGQITAMTYINSAGLIGAAEEADIRYTYSNISGVNAGLISRISADQIGDRNSVTHSHATGDTTLAGLIGSATGTYIDRVYATGNVTASATQVAGGLIATYSARTPGSNTIQNAFATGNVIGGSGIGGLIGRFDTHTSALSYIRNAYATGNVTSLYETRKTTEDTGVGGFIGMVTYAGSEDASAGVHISDSFATGNVRTDAPDSAEINGIGGFIGSMSSPSGKGGSTIINSYATGDVYAPGAINVGGFVGNSGYTSYNNAYATGNVTGAAVGGFAGSMMNGSVTNSYSQGTVTRVASEYWGNGYYSGGFIGRGAQMTITNSYYNKDGLSSNITSGLGNEQYYTGEPLGMTGLTGAQLADAQYYANGTIDQVLANRAAEAERIATERADAERREAERLEAQRLATERLLDRIDSAAQVAGQQRNTIQQLSTIKPDFRLAASLASSKPVPIDQHIVRTSDKAFSADVQRIEIDGATYDLQEDERAKQ